MKHLLLAACLCCAAAGGAAAQPETREGIALQNQILDLRRQIQDLQAQRGQGSSGGSYLGGRSSAPPPSGAPNEITAQLLDRVATLEDAVRQLRGRQDELANTEQRHYEDLSKQIGDLAFKLPGGGPSGSGAPPSPSGPQPGVLGALPVQGSPPPLTGPVRRTPELALQEGNTAMVRRDYATAEADAREVLANNRTSPRAYDAQFLLAQALAAKHDNPQAAIAFDDAYNRSRTGIHAPEALLGLADSLGAINERKAACDTLVKLQTEFPKMRPDLKAAADGSRQRNGCR